MDWICLGHAMWLFEVGGKRVLCDPLLGATHHAGVFRVQPRRTVNLEALRPDLVVVSHRHGDHFDVPSLHRLAVRYPEAALITADEHVGWAARELGFADVEVVPVGHQIEIGGATLITTPSLSPIEWGLLVGSPDGVVWNQIDAVLPNAAKAAQIAQALCGHLGAPGVTLALARWNPLLEVAAPLNRRTDFPRDTYAGIVEQLVAIGPKAVVPSAAGGCHTADFSWMDHYVYPVSESRFLADLAVVAPTTQGLPHVTGGRYRIRNHAVTFDPEGGADLVSIEPTPDPRDFRPLAIPPLADPNPIDEPEPALRETVGAWIRGDLASALHARWPELGVDRPLRFVVEVTYPSGPQAITLEVGPDGVVCRDGFDADWDALNAVAGSLLAQVVRGERHWGDVLLAGCLRTANRAYRRRAGVIEAANVPDTFLYLAIPYATSEIRALRWAVRTALGQN